MPGRLYEAFSFWLLTPGSGFQPARTPALKCGHSDSAEGCTNASLVFGISPGDPLHVGGAALALAAAARIGSMIPALHASRLDPIDALREE